MYNKEGVVCIHMYTHTHRYTMGYHSAVRKNILPFVTTQTKLEGIILSAIRKTERQMLYDITYMLNIKHMLIEEESRMAVNRG